MVGDALSRGYSGRGHIRVTRARPYLRDSRINALVFTFLPATFLSSPPHRAILALAADEALRHAFRHVSDGWVRAINWPRKLDYALLPLCRRTYTVAEQAVPWQNEPRSSGLGKRRLTRLHARRQESPLPIAKLHSRDGLNADRITIVGNLAALMLAPILRSAAREFAGLDVQVLDVTGDSTSTIWLRNSIGTCLAEASDPTKHFSDEVSGYASELAGNFVVNGTGATNRVAILALRAMKARCANFLTDDPWNHAHRAAWFLEALPDYDFGVFTTAGERRDLEDARL